MLMKAILFSLLLLFTCNVSSCSPADEVTVKPPAETPGGNGENGNDDTDTPNSPDKIENMKLKITIGNSILTATLEDNPTTRDFITLLPITVKLDDYNRTEKIFYPESKLSTKDAPSSINPVAGDITYYSPWGNIAIFYKDFRQSGGLIRIAKIDGNIDALQVSGSIENVYFEIIEKDN